MTADRKHFVVSSGRAGSTLLSAIMSHAGADFGFAATTEWDPKAGGFEPKAASLAAEHARRAVELKTFSHISRARMWRRKWHRACARRHLARLLAEVDYVKLSNSDLLRWARAIGYVPSVLLLYRSFGGYARSSFLRSGRDYDGMADHYLNAYRTGLVALEVFGGCIVRYDELADRAASAWLDRVVAVTGLDREALQSARDRLVTDNLAQGNGAVVEDPRMTALEDAVAARVRDVVPAGRLASRGV